MFLSAIGIIICFALLIGASWKKVSMFLAAVVGACIIAVTSGLNLVGAIEDSFITGFIGFTKSWLIVLSLGGLLGRLYSDSGAAWRIGDTLIRKFGSGFALMIYILVGALLVYCGILPPLTLFVLLPIAKTLFPKAGIPWKLFPAVTGFAILTFAMYAPGSLQTVNLIPVNFFGISTTAAPLEGMVAAFFLFIVGLIYLKWEIKRASNLAESDTPQLYFVAEEMGNEDNLYKSAPHFAVSLIPLVLTLILVNIIKVEFFVGFGVGCVTALVLFWRSLPDKATSISRGFEDGIIPCVLVSAVTGLGSVISATPVFSVVQDSVMKLPINGLAKVAVVTTLLAGICASGTGGLQLSLSLFSEEFLAWGYSPDIIARVAAVACGGLDSLPWNGSIVMLFAVCGVSYNKGYKPVAVLTVILPILASLVAALAYTIKMMVLG